MRFEDYLATNNGKKFYLDPHSGNNGDLLIWKGMHEVLQRTKVNVVSNIPDADILLINGGGKFIDAYKWGVEKIQQYSQMYPDKPLCIAPSSFYFEKLDFGNYLDMRKAPLILFAREHFSKNIIDPLAESRPLIESHLDHDLAFRLEESHFISDINSSFPVPTEGRVLVVDRMDHERPGNSHQISLINRLYANIVPKFIKGIIRRRRVDSRNVNGTAFTREALKQLKEQHPAYSPRQVITIDLSRNDIFSFNEFVTQIAEAEFVFTNRLHVGVLAHLLDRRVYLMEGSYHKISGVYPYSMAHKNSTRLFYT